MHPIEFLTVEMGENDIALLRIVLSINVHSRVSPDTACTRMPTRVEWETRQPGYEDYHRTSQKPLCHIYLIGEEETDFQMVGGIKCRGPTKSCFQHLTNRKVLWPVQHLSHPIHVAPSHSRDNLTFPPHQPITTVQPPSIVHMEQLDTPLHPAPQLLHSPTRHPFPIGSPRLDAAHARLEPYDANEPVTKAITRSSCTSLEAARRVTSAIAVIGTCFSQPVAPKVYSRMQAAQD